MTWKRFATMAVVLCAAAGLLAGCGGGGDGVDRSAHDQLQADLEAAQAELERIEAEEAAAAAKAAAEAAAAKKAEEEAAALKAEEDAKAAEAARIKAAQDAAQKELDDRIARLTEQLAAIAAAQEETPEPEAEEEEEETPAATTTTPATTPTTTTTPATTPAATTTTGTTTSGTQTAEASQRAENLRKALVDETVPATPVFSVSGASPVMFSVLTRNSLRAVRSGYTSATPSAVSGTKMRRAELPLTAGAARGKTVVYTDIELSRNLVHHYLPATDTRIPLNQAVQNSGQDTAAALTDNTIPQNHVNWAINHGVTTSVRTVDTNADGALDALPAAAENARTPATSYSGSLHGVPGRFICGGTNCRLQVTPNYDETDLSQAESLLLDVALATVNAQGQAVTETIYFVPSTTLPLWKEGPVGLDSEYMVFGYWRDDPASAAGVYQFQAFADTVGTGTNNTPVAATYDGIAVGAYAEKDPGAVVDTWRQGDFTADVHLMATSSAVEGTIDNFVATPTGGSTAPKTADRWVVTLEDGATDVSLNLPGETAGNWTREFVQVRAAEGGVASPAVTGTFNAHIPDSVTIVGAFGAEKR